jgi:TRAP-type mannitol/chloroaromatic compound transport system substrate-binding protein
VAKYYYYPGWWEGGAMLHMIVNEEKWSALPKQYQAVLSQAGAGSRRLDDREIRQRQSRALKRLIAGGAELRAFPQPVLEACYQATQGTSERDRRKSELFKQTKESHDAYMKECCSTRRSRKTSTTTICSARCATRPDWKKRARC